MEENKEIQEEINDENIEVLSYKDVKLEYAEKPFNYKKLFSIIFTVIIIAILSLAFILYEKNNKNVFRHGLTSLGNDIENSILDIKGSDFISYSENNPFKTTLLLSFNTTFDETKLNDNEIEFLKMLHEMALSFSLDMDYQNKALTHDFKITYAGNNMFEIFGNGKSSNITYKIKNVLKKYINLNINGFENIFKNKEKNKKEIDEIKKIIFKEIYNEINEKDFKRNKTTLTLNNKKLDVKDVVLSYDDKKIKELLINVIDNLKNNEDFIKKTSSFTSLAQTRLKEYIDILKQNIENINFNNIDLHIYSKGIFNKVYGYKLDSDNFEILYLKNNDKKIELKINENKYIFEIQKNKENDKYILNGPNINLEAIKTVNKDDTVIEYKINNYEGNIVITKEIEANGINGNNKITLTKKELDEELSNIYMTINYSIKKENKITLYDDSDNIKNENLTLNDKKTMIEKINNSTYFKLAKQKISNYLIKE